MYLLVDINVVLFVCYQYVFKFLAAYKSFFALISRCGIRANHKISYEQFLEKFQMPVAKANGQTIPIKPSHKYANYFASEKNYQNFDFCTFPSKTVINVLLVERKTCCHVTNAFLSKSELIWPVSSVKISRMSKNVFWAKISRRQWVKHAQ